jgi:hypothetical protein
MKWTPKMGIRRHVAKRKSRSLTATVIHGMPGLLPGFDERKAQSKE